MSFSLIKEEYQVEVWKHEYMVDFKEPERLTFFNKVDLIRAKARHLGFSEATIQSTVISGFTSAGLLLNSHLQLIPPSDTVSRFKCQNVRFTIKREELSNGEKKASFGFELF